MPPAPITALHPTVSATTLSSRGIRRGRSGAGDRHGRRRRIHGAAAVLAQAEPARRQRLGGGHPQAISGGGLKRTALRPELFGDRVVAAALIATSAGGLAGVTLGLPDAVGRVVHQAVRAGLSLLRRQPRLVDAVRRVTGGMSFRFTQHYLFDSEVLDPVAAVTVRAMASTPIAVIADFFSELDTFDKRAALSTLGQVPTLVLVGERDKITPVTHSEILAREIPGAELAVISDAAHFVILERPQEVNHYLHRLVTRATQRRPDTPPSEHGESKQRSAGSFD